MNRKEGDEESNYRLGLNGSMIAVEAEDCKKVKTGREKEIDPVKRYLTVVINDRACTRFGGVWLRLP